MTSKEALLDIKKRNEALKKERHFHIGEMSMSIIEQLVERDTPKKPINCNYGLACPNCKSYRIESYNYDQSEVKLDFCQDCGQRLDWSEQL